MDTQTVINTAVLSASPRTENKGQKAEQTAVKKGYRSNTYFLLKLLLTVSGFIIAIGVNLFFPQKAEIVIKDYALSAFGLTLNLTMNDAYIFVLVMLIVIYTVTGLVSAGNKERRKKFCKNAAFRFALGIGLALWDIGGTKLAFFPQPFFPGPAQVIEAYLSDGEYIIQNIISLKRIISENITESGDSIALYNDKLIRWRESDGRGSKTGSPDSHELCGAAISEIKR